MKKWILKAVVQKGISFLPMKHRINYLFQKHVTKGVQLSDAYLSDRLGHFRQHFSFHQRYAEPGMGQPVVLELGTGWYPVVPLCFFLCGAAHIHTIDISRLTDREKLRTTIARLLDWIDAGKPDADIRPDIQRLKALRALHDEIDRLGLDEIFKRLHITYWVADARHLPMPPQSVDFIVSNNTFEHVYPGILADILRAFRRVLRPGGVMCHFIDMSDHFAHLDHSITIYNFLRFSARTWQWIDNDIQPQNRWRITHYRALYAELGWPVTDELLRPGHLPDLRRVPLADEFSGISPQDLAVSHGYMVSKLPA